MSTTKRAGELATCPLCKFPYAIVEEEYFFADDRIEKRIVCEACKKTTNLKGESV